jgi:hypothetical protein
VRDGRIIALVDNFPAIDFDARPSGTDAEAEVGEMMRTLSSAASVTNGPLWRDERGRLCGYQLVRLKPVSSILAAANALIGAECRAEQERRRGAPGGSAGGESGRAPGSEPPGKLASVDEWFDEAVLARFVDAAWGHAAFVSLRGGALVVFLPADEAHALSFRQAATAEIRRALGSAASDPEGWQLLEFLGRNRIATEIVPGGLEIVLGDPSAAELALDLPPRGRTGTDLGEALAAAGWVIGGQDGEARAQEAFAEQCARD